MGSRAERGAGGAATQDTVVVVEYYESLVERGKTIRDALQEVQVEKFVEYINDPSNAAKRARHQLECLQFALSAKNLDLIRAMYEPFLDRGEPGKTLPRGLVESLDFGIAESLKRQLALVGRVSEVWGGNSSELLREPSTLNHSKAARRWMLSNYEGLMAEYDSRQPKDDPIIPDGFKPAEDDGGSSAADSDGEMQSSELPRSSARKEEEIPVSTTMILYGASGVRGSNGGSSAREAHCAVCSTSQGGWIALGLRGATLVHHDPVRDFSRFL
jgi:hypothetical protein